MRIAIITVETYFWLCVRRLLLGISYNRLKMLRELLNSAVGELIMFRSSPIMRALHALSKNAFSLIHMCCEISFNRITKSYLDIELCDEEAFEYNLIHIIPRDMHIENLYEELLSYRRRDIREIMVLIK